MPGDNADGYQSSMFPETERGNRTLLTTLCSRKQLPEKIHLPPWNHRFSACLSMTRPDTHPPNPCSLLHKWLPELFVPTDQLEYKVGEQTLDKLLSFLQAGGLGPALSLSLQTSSPENRLASRGNSHSSALLRRHPFIPLPHSGSFWTCLLLSRNKTPSSSCLKGVQIFWSGSSPDCNRPIAQLQHSKPRAPQSSFQIKPLLIK